MRMKVSHISSEQSNGDDPGQSALFAFQDFKFGFRPNFPLFPLAGCSQASHARDCCGFLRKVFEPQPGERSSASRYREKCKSS